MLNPDKSLSSGREAPRYRVWGVDDVSYGPLAAETLAAWARTRRIGPENWVFCETDQAWRKAGERSELQELFRREPPPMPFEHIARVEGLKGALGLLRGLDLFTGLTDAQIESFAHYAEIVHFKQFTRFVQKGDPGDAMFIVLDGEVRAYFIANGRECTLSTIGPGEFIGEISLLDQGPRSADLAANVDTTLLRISVTQFDALSIEAPALAAPFLMALSRTVVRRIRNTTQRYQDSIHYMGRKIPGWSG